MLNQMNHGSKLQVAALLMLSLFFQAVPRPVAAVTSVREAPVTANDSPPADAVSTAFLPNPQPLPPVAPVITATETDDITLANKKNPGATIDYTITIQNTGTADATGVQFNQDVNSLTTLVDASRMLAMADSYTTIGDVQISIPAPGVLANDLDLTAGNSASMTTTAQTISSTNCTGGCSNNVVIGSDGSFTYDPPVGFTGTDTFTYTAHNNANTRTAQATAQITVAGRIWFINNNAGACTSNCDGRLSHPFTTLAAFNTANGGGAGKPAANDNIFVYTGSGLYTGGVTLLSGQKLIGQGAPASVETITGLSTPSGSTVLPATGGTNPQLTNTAVNGDVVTLNDGNTVEGLTVTGATRDGIAGASHAGFTANTVTFQNNTAAGLHLTSMTGTVTVTNATISGNATGLGVNSGTATITVTNSTISGNATGLDVNNGTAAISLNNTNTITANAGQRQVSIQNRPGSAGTIDVGATINDSAVGSTGILVNSNLSGTINFSGSQTLRTTTNTAVNLTTNTNTTINFSGTLGITTTTGIGLNATGGGTLNVTGTANVTTGAAANGVNINGVTVGGSGATFTSINTTTATTGVSLTSIGNGNVTINGGTISGGTTSLSLNTLGSSNTTLSGVHPHRRDDRDQRQQFRHAHSEQYGSLRRDCPFIEHRRTERFF